MLHNAYLANIISVTSFSFVKRHNVCSLQMQFISNFKMVQCKFTLITTRKQLSGLKNE